MPTERMYHMATRYPAAAVFSVRDAVDRLFNETFSPGMSQNIWSASNNGARADLPLDVYATSNEVVILAAIPGITPDEIEITVEKNTVTLSGEIKNVVKSEEAKDASWYLHELPRGTFRRSLTLPIEVDSAKAEANFQNGMLRLSLPKAEAAKPRQIRVQVTGGETAAISEDATSSASS